MCCSRYTKFSVAFYIDLHAIEELTTSCLCSEPLIFSKVPHHPTHWSLRVFMTGLVHNCYIGAVTLDFNQAQRTCDRLACHIAS
ncbi:hypothetical protein XENOCAPTIV_029337 [Xenoophorus captivus]|uniref:Uncharacterized protein n=1 Tax=Xenoophorus captivus TaxID=1517983 RepID=A0ABV0S418_9TELE